MKDYKPLWAKWFAFLNMDAKFRKEILDAVHIETKRGMDVLMKLSIEELESKLSNKALYKTIIPSLETTISVALWAGYSLFLIEHEIDPVKENLLARTETNELGNVWMESYEKDQCKELLLAIDPIIAMLLEKQTQTQVNELFVLHPELGDSPYKEIGHVDRFYNWLSQQGYILGILEEKLSKREVKTPEQAHQFDK